MVIRKPSFLTTGLAVLCAVCIALSSWYAYKTGCAADLKTGSWGNMELGLHFSQISFIWFVSAITAGILVIVSLRGPDAPDRAAMATVFFFAGGLAFWLLTNHFETMGLLSCSAA